ncbi:hypothetical protein SKAU_G00191960 [Synaphobranchus kaupii]|uniref:Reverse transcriptase domain-containing protein n=1 Tax=Synaphobranchus kaupii TaxID=118154 RepID=A0A9Q1FDW2_SYNKA|nr:hypothetical protein SKAU_G00191960 [Synaphobranchus kaupii]
MLIRLVAVGKKLFLWRTVLVFIDRSLLPEGSGEKRPWPGWEGSAMIFLARFSALESCSCTSSHQSVKLLKFADDTTLIGLISKGDESAYRGSELRDAPLTVSPGLTVSDSTWRVRVREPQLFRFNIYLSQLIAFHITERTG